MHFMRNSDSVPKNCHQQHHHHFVIINIITAIISALNTELKKVLTDKSVAAYLQERGMDPSWSTPEEMLVRIRRDRARWVPVVKELNFTMES